MPFTYYVRMCNGNGDCQTGYYFIGSCPRGFVFGTQRSFHFFESGELFHAALNTVLVDCVGATIQFSTAKFLGRWQAGFSELGIL